MSISIKQRLYAVTIIPLLVVSIGILAVTYFKTTELSHALSGSAQSNLLNTKKEELKYLVEAARSSVQHLIDEGRPLEAALPILRNLEFGSDGYIFGYDGNGVRVVVGKSQAELGKSFYNAQDHRGNYFIQDLINNARTGEFTTYYFPKPGQDTAEPKLSYSVFIPEWNLMIGTGLYIDDIDAITTAMANDADSALNQTIYAIEAFIAISVLLVLALTTFINRSILNPLNKLNASLSSFASGDADLTARMEPYEIPEYKAMSQSFNAFVSSLQEIVTRVATTSKSVAEETKAMNSRALQVDALANSQNEENRASGNSNDGNDDDFG